MLTILVTLVACVANENPLGSTRSALELPDPGTCQTLVGDVLIDSNSDMALFGSLGCERVEGNLRVTNVTSLSGLSTLTSISGNLFIDGVQASDLVALENLDAVSGSVSITASSFTTINWSIAQLDRLVVRGNPDLTSVTLGSVTSLPSGLLITSNPALTSIALPQLTQVDTLKIVDHANLDTLAFDSLTTVNGDLDIRTNVALRALTGFASLQSVGRSLALVGNGLRSLDGLDALTSVAENVLLSRNNALTDVTGLGSLFDVSGSFIVRGNSLLPDFDGMSSLQTIGGRIFVSDNSLISSFQGLSALRSVSRIHVENNDSLISLSGLTALNTVDAIVIRSNPSLSSLGGIAYPLGVNLYISANVGLQNFADLPSTAIGSLQIIDNDGLDSTISIDVPEATTVLFTENGTVTDLSFPSLDTADSLSIVDNSSLRTISAASLVSADLTIDLNNDLISIAFPVMTSGVDVNLRDNPNLASIDLSALSSCTDDLRLVGSAVTSLSGFGSLSNLADDLEISSNTSLTSFAGANSLTTIGGSFVINNNNALMSLSDLTTVNTVVGNLTITDNNILQDCEATDLATSITFIGGTTTIMNNGGIMGCP